MVFSRKRIFRVSSLKRLPPQTSHVTHWDEAEKTLEGIPNRNAEDRLLLERIRRERAAPEEPGEPEEDRE